MAVSAAGTIHACSGGRSERAASWRSQRWHSRSSQQPPQAPQRSLRKQHPQRRGTGRRNGRQRSPSCPISRRDARRRSTSPPGSESASRLTTRTAAPDECDGVGKRIISSTDDVYLYNKFTCGFAIRRWTPAALNAAWQHMAELACESQKNDAAAYDACQQAALKDRVNIKTGGFGGTGLWLTDAAKRETSTLRVQVTGRFTAIVTWLGQSWKMTIQPTG